MPIPSLHQEAAVAHNHNHISDAVGANVEALDLVGLVTDYNREAVTLEVARDFHRLGQLGIQGELFVALPDALASLAVRVAALDAKSKAVHDTRIPAAHVDAKFWIPDTAKSVHSREDLGRLGPEYDNRKWISHGRVIVPNPDHPDEPLLHHVGLPYDECYAKLGEETQLKLFAAQKARFELTHDGTNLNPLTARDVTIIALIRQIKGEPMPFSRGFMHDASLVRVMWNVSREVTFVGIVGSRSGQLRLGKSGGRAHPNIGIAVSAGINDT